MAIISKGILGGIHGTVGNVVGSSWREIEYIRTRPRRSKRTPSQKQLEQQVKFGLSLEFMKLLRRAFEVGHIGVRFARSTVYSQSFGHILRKVVVGEFPNYRLDYSKVQISRGPVVKLPDLSWKKVGNEKVSFTWTNDRNLFGADDSDQVLAIMMDVERKTVWMHGGVQRKDLKLEMPVNPHFEQKNLIAWVFLFNEEHRLCSESEFLSDLKNDPGGAAV